MSNEIIAWAVYCLILGGSVIFMYASPSIAEFFGINQKETTNI